MIVNCSNCATRLQLDDAKLPAHPFSVKCPKCQTPIGVQPPATKAMNNGGTHEASVPARFETVTPAPISELEKEKMNQPAPRDGSSSNTDGNASATSETSELTRVLTALLQRGTQSADTQRNASRLAWERRRALVCVADKAKREAVARALAQSDCQTFVPEDVTQALEKMREERMDVVVLDPEFDPLEQGAAFVTREVSALRPVERRRLFLVSLHATARTGDAHAAFISNVNLVINQADIETLPRSLERAVRDYNDLYSDFNRALNIAAL